MQEILSAPEALRTHQGGRRPHQHRQCRELALLLDAARTQAVAKIDAHIATLNKDDGRSPGRSRPAGGVPQAAGDPEGSRCRRKKASPTSPRPRAEAVKEFDAAVAPDRGRSFASWPSRRSRRTTGRARSPGRPLVKKQRIVKPADIVKTTYLETSDDVNGFLDALRQELEKAIANNERIQIR